MLSGVKKLSEKFFGFGAISGMSFFDGGERTDIQHLPVVLNTGGKTLPALPYTLVAGSVLRRLSHISVILAGGRLTKICYPVVQSVAVNVVDLIWKVAINPQPNKPVGQFSLPVDADLGIPIVTNTPNYTTSRCARYSNVSAENTFFMVIVKQLADFIMRNFVAFKFSHGASFQS